MEQAFYRIISIIPVLGIMIVVHELGHFLAAKFFKVRVEAFSVGFGKPLFARKWGETEYRISPIPLGGYVKMAGETPLDERSGDPGEFMSHPRWQRLIIAFAGPFMNVLLAVILLTGVYMTHYERPYAMNKPAVVGDVVEGSPAEAAGLRPDDRIVQVAGIENPTWQDVRNREFLSGNQNLSIVVQRGNERIPLTVVPQAMGQDKVGVAGWLPAQPFVVTQVVPNSPADHAGIKVDDKVVALNGTPVRSTNDLLRNLQKLGGVEAQLTVERAGKPLNLRVTPTTVLDVETQGKPQYRIGIASNPTQVDKLAFGQAFQRSIDQNKNYSMLIFELVHKMLERKVSVAQMESPIRISVVTGEAVRQRDWTVLMEIMAAISLNLGIFNLFPIPILDGGLILMLLIEGLIRRDISQPIKERVYQAAFVCLILFAGIVIFNDVMKEFTGFAHRFQ